MFFGWNRVLLTDKIKIYCLIWKEVHSLNKTNVLLLVNKETLSIQRRAMFSSNKNKLKMKSSRLIKKKSEP